MKNWTLNGSKTTETFSITKTTWRVRWECADMASFSVYGPDRKIVTSGASEKGGDLSVIHEGPGTYYLMLSAMFAPATFYVEEPDDEGKP